MLFHNARGTQLLCRATEKEASTRFLMPFPKKSTPLEENFHAHGGTTPSFWRLNAIPLATKRQGVALRRHAAEKFWRQRTLKHGTLRISHTAESSRGARQKADKASLPVHASR